MTKSKLKESQGYRLNKQLPQDSVESTGSLLPDSILAVVNDRLELVYFNNSFSTFAQMATGIKPFTGQLITTCLPAAWCNHVTLAMVRPEASILYENRVTLQFRDKKYPSNYNIQIQRSLSGDKRGEELIIRLTDDTLNNSLHNNFREDWDLKNCVRNLITEWCEHLGQRGGEVWVMDQNEQKLRLLALQIDGRDIEYKDISVMTTNEGLPWKAKTEDAIVFIKDLTSDSVYLRKTFAALHGFTSATAIPIKINHGKFIGTIIFYSRSGNNAKPIIVPAAVVSLLGVHIEQKLSNDNLQRLFKYSPDLLCVVSPQGLFTKVNPAFSELLGYTEQELLTQPFFNFLHPDDLAITHKQMDEIAKGKLLKSFYNRYRTKSGKLVWISWNTSSILNEEGSFYAFGKDVTEEKNLQELIYEVGKRARFGSYEIDFTTDKIFCSPGAKSVYEIDETREITFDYMMSHYKPNGDRERYLELIAKGKSAPAHWEEEFLITTDTGKDRWVQVIGTSEHVNGHCTRIYGSVQDIHERKLAKLRITKLLEERNNILESIGDGFLSLDNNWKITYWNHQSELATGKNRNEVIGREYWDVVPKQDYEVMYRLCKDAKASGESRYVELRYNSSDTWYALSIYPHDYGISIFVKDITERIKAEEKIRISNERFELMAKATNNVIWEYDFLADKMIMLGEGFTDMLGYPTSALDKPGFLDSLVHPDDLPGLEKYKIDSINDPSTTIMQAEYRTMTKNRGYIYIYVKALIQRDKNGHATRMIGSTQDIHERKVAELSAASLLKERNNILESIGDGFLSMDNNWKITYWNRQLELLTDQKRWQVIGRSYWDMVPKEMHTEISNLCAIAKSTGHTQYKEMRGINDNTWYGVSYYPHDYGMSVFVRDITDRIISEEKIRISNERFELLAKAANEMIWDYDFVTDTVVMIGDGFEKLLGYPAEEGVTVDFLKSLVHPDDLSRVLEFREATLKDTSKNSGQLELRLLSKHNGYITVLEKSVIIRNEKGIAVRMIGSTQDISYQKEYENSLRELNTKIERYAKNLAASNAELEQFAYVASHDLQEPLRMVSSFMGLLEKNYSDKLDDRGKQFIHFAVDGAQRMKKIIVDLLEYSRVNRFSKEKEDVDLNELVEQATSLLRSVITEKNAVFHVNTLPVIHSHRTPLQQIFQNLIGNALKYTAQGVPPEITITYKDLGNEHYISIADNGIGIDPAYSEKIFGLFYRLNPRSEYEGTGLGLSVCKRIIETLGGRIWVDSEPGKGSNFQFTIPKTL